METSNKVLGLPHSVRNGIAVVGLSCRFPGASSVSAYRNMLSGGESAFRTLTLDEVLSAGVPHSVAMDPCFVRVAAPLTGIGEFDVDTFRLTPDDVGNLDPQHYHFLECSYEALRTANDSLLGEGLRVGVFGGADISYFASEHMADEALWDPMGHWTEILRNDSHFLTTSVSYRLDLRGPSVEVQTACSTSLVAVHMAAQSLCAGECDVALAGGVSIRGPQTRGYYYRDGGILSPSGQCRPFDQRADGTILSSGVGVVTLVRVPDAISLRLPVWAVLKGSAVNNDGGRKAGYTAPSVEGQASAVAEAISAAGVDPETIGYVEAHGTGTNLGDPLEHDALVLAYGSRVGPCTRIPIGSVKSNFGHLESASGVAGLIKTVLSVRYGEIYPSLGYQSPNPGIDFASGPFFVTTRRGTYEARGQLRRAGVSSFGIGGTNCHVILEEWPRRDPPPADPRSCPFQRTATWTAPRVAVTQTGTAAGVRRVDDDIESVIRELWETLLGVTPEREDDFIGLGGDSLQAAQLAGRIHKTLGARVSVTDVLEAPSFGAFVQRVAELSSEASDGTYGLSSRQRSLWLWQTHNPESAAYTVQAVYRLSGNLDKEALRASFSDLLERQDALRTAFEDSGVDIEQRVCGGKLAVPWQEEHVDEGARCPGSLLEEHGQTVFDLTNPPLLSVLLIDAPDNSTVLSVASHHIVSDEWSAQVMLRDVLEFYAARVENRQPRLPDIPTSLGRLADEETGWLKSGSAASRLSYWERTLADVPTVDLPYDRPRPLKPRHTGSSLDFSVGAETYRKVRALAQELRATPFVVLTASFAALLLRYTRQPDLCVGTNVAGREDPQSANVVGYLTDTVPLRMDLSGNPTFEEVVRRVREVAFDAYDKHLPFSVVVEAMRTPRIPSRNPLFDVLIVLQNVPQSDLSAPSLSIEPIPFHNGTCKFDMELTLEESSDGALIGRWEYDSQLFDAETVADLSRSFSKIVESSLDDPACTVQNLPMYSVWERTDLADRWNDTDTEFPDADMGLWKLYCRKAEQQLSSIAVMCAEGEAVTYEELRDRAASVAEALLSEGVKPGEVVGLLCARSEMYIRGMLGILAAGAAFLPLDTGLPATRIAGMIQKSGIRTIVSEMRYRGRVPWEETRLVSVSPEIVLTLDHHRAVREAGEGPPAPSDLAYVIYTSGSTGSPKGAMVGHSAMLNHVLAKIETLSLGGDSRVAQTAPACFDISIWQCLAPLLAGGSVVVIDDTAVADVQTLAGRVREHRVSVLELVPSHLDVLLSHLESSGAPLPSLEVIVSTGENLPAETCRRWFALFPDVPIVNAYGPTECADDVLQHSLDQPPDIDATIVPVGSPLPNVKVYVLDDNLMPVPAGAVGEICVAGVCVGYGYLGDVEQTAASFVPSPFSDDYEETLYKTGDLGRRSRDGPIICLGRKDRQVKVHGARVEVEEIEATLRRLQGVGDAAVALDDAGESLVALVVPEPSEECLDIDALRNHAVTNLPGFMVPALFFFVREVPRIASGKLDRGALCDAIERARGADSIGKVHAAEASSPTMGELHDIWCKVLRRSAIPVDADFFSIGGDSLKAMRVAMLAQQSGVPITAAEVLEHPTIRSSAEHADASGRVEFNSSDEVTGFPGLTKGEHWFLGQNLPDEHLHDTAFALTLSPTTSARSIEDAVGQLWRKHDALRAVYGRRENRSVSKTVLRATASVPFSVLEPLRGSCTDAALLWAERNRITPSAGPLFRATLLKQCESTTLLAIAHYLVCDAISWQILLDELEDLLGVGPHVIRLQGTRSTKPNMEFDLPTDERAAALTADETEALIGALDDSRDTLESAIACALVLAAARPGDARVMPIAIGRHGRQVHDQRHDSSGTVGRFAYPETVGIEVRKDDQLRDTIARFHSAGEESAVSDLSTTPSPTGGNPRIALDFIGSVPEQGMSGGAIRRIERLPRRDTLEVASPFEIELLAQTVGGRLMLLVHSACGRDRADYIAQATADKLRALAAASGANRE